jgi:succinyl-diaminopimelate desuccinylase
VPDVVTSPPVDLLALTAELVDIASESHHEGPITDHIEAMLRAVPWLRVDRDGLNLVARTSFGRPLRVVLAGHTDTVAVNANLPARVEGDVLWGCGSADMKSGLAVMLALATSLDTAALDVTYVFYEAEEAAAPFNGLGKLFAAHPQWVRGDVALLGEPTAAGIEAGCQGTVRIEVTFSGERAHTARPWMGRNAIHRMGAAATVDRWMRVPRGAPGRESDRGSVGQRGPRRGRVDDQSPLRP